ncbi:MAG: delta-60 repeat domain-containing protein, partial [Limisphaerales bacterium]
PEYPDEIPLQAGSEYALPPGASEYGTNPDFDSVTGQLSWGSFDGTPKPITIDITNYNDVEFNQDLLVELYFPGTQPTSLTDRGLGNVHFCVLTILFDNERGDAQPAGALDRMHNMDDDSSTLPHPYNLHPGANNTVYAVAVQSDGKSVIGGDFSAYDTEVRNRIARMNANGLLDTTFNPPGGADQFVSCLAIDPAGNVVAGGAFNSMNGINSKGVARLLPNGTSDTSFSPGAGASDIVWALAFQTNSIIVAGQFTYFNNLPASFIARLSPAGAFDQSFVPNIDGPIQAVAVQPDGKILIGGDFLTVNGTPRTRMARLNANGSLDTSFDPGYGFDNTVYTIVLQSDGRIVAGGSFQNVGAQSRNSIVRLNSNGSVDQSFAPGEGADDTIYSINIQPDGGIIACGVFSTFNQVRRNTMVRLFPNGVVDTGFMDTAYNQFAGLPTHYWDPNVETRNFIYSSALQPDGNLMIAGGFHRVGGGWTRDDVRYRENVCRIIGGATPGPGNMSFAYNSISADQFSDQVFVTLNRQNGTLGP